MTDNDRNLGGIFDFGYDNVKAQPKIEIIERSPGKTHPSDYMPWNFKKESNHRLFQYNPLLHIRHDSRELSKRDIDIQLFLFLTLQRVIKKKYPNYIEYRPFTLTFSVTDIKNFLLDYYLDHKGSALPRNWKRAFSDSLKRIFDLEYSISDYFLPYVQGENVSEDTEVLKIYQKDLQGKKNFYESDKFKKYQEGNFRYISSWAYADDTQEYTIKMSEEVVFFAYLTRNYTSIKLNDAYAISNKHLYWLYLLIEQEKKSVETKASKENLKKQKEVNYVEIGESRIFYELKIPDEGKKRYAYKIVLNAFRKEGIESFFSIYPNFSYEYDAKKKVFVFSGVWD